MASRALLLLRGGSTPTNHHCPSLMTINTIFSNPLAQFKFNNRVTGVTIRTCSSSAAPSSSSSLDPPDVSRLAQTARISLTPQEVEEFTPKIQQVVEWFGQLQDVELSSIEPALRADTDSNQLREDIPETFENREAMISSVPSYEEPFIKVPRVLSKE